MTDLPERPAIRSIEVKETQDKGQRVFVLRDPLRLSDDVVVVNIVGVAICEFLDGPRTSPELARAFERAHGVKLQEEQIAGLVRGLDAACLFKGGKAQSVLETWRKDPVRKAA